MKRRRWLVGALGATVPMLGLSPLPAQAADVPQPQLDSYVVAITQPSTPDPARTIVGCTNQVFDCGIVSVYPTFSHLDGISTTAESQLAQTNLTGTARLTRIYGCQTRHGRRLPKYDRKVVQDPAFLNTRNGFGFKITPGATTVSPAAFDFLRDAQPGNCPAKTQATQYAIKVTRLVLTLEDHGVTPTATYPFEASGTWIWRGAVPTIPR